jgi:hypothetical protein
VEYLQKALRLERKLLERLSNLEMLAINCETESEIDAAQSKASNTRLRLRKVNAIVSKWGKEYAVLQNRIDSVWEHYIFTKHPEALAEYIALGGVIDDRVRDEIVLRLEKGPPDGTGGRNNIRDIKVYLAIKSIHLGHCNDLFGQVYDGVDGPTRSVRSALKIYIEGLGRGVEDGTIRKQYERGRELMGDGNKE